MFDGSFETMDALEPKWHTTKCPTFSSAGVAKPPSAARLYALCQIVLWLFVSTSSRWAYRTGTELDHRRRLNHWGQRDSRRLVVLDLSTPLLGSAQPAVGS